MLPSKIVVIIVCFFNRGVFVNALTPTQRPTTPYSLPLQIRTIVGTGGNTYGDGQIGQPAINAQLDSPRGVLLDTLGNMYISDCLNHAIRKVSAFTWTLSTPFGAKGMGSGGDGGPANQAPCGCVAIMGFDSQTNLYLPDRDYYSVRVVNEKTGIVNRFAGSYSSGWSGDGGSASSAKLKVPNCVWFDTNDNAYIADSAHHTIRKVDSVSKSISTICGSATTTESAGNSGDGGAGPQPN